MSYRPHPDADRARHQLERGRVRRVLQPSALGIPASQAIAAFESFQRQYRNAALGTLQRIASAHGRRTGKSAITAAIVDQAVKAGEHVHVAGREGVRCAGGDEACPLPRIGSGDHVVVEYDGHRARYEVTDIPFREGPGSLTLTLRLADDAEVTGQ